MESSDRLLLNLFPKVRWIFHNEFLEFEAGRIVIYRNVRFPRVTLEEFVKFETCGHGFRVFSTRCGP